MPNSHDQEGANTRTFFTDVTQRLWEESKSDPTKGTPESAYLLTKAPPEYAPFLADTTSARFLDKILEDVRRIKRLPATPCASFKYIARQEGEPFP